MVRGAFYESGGFGGVVGADIYMIPLLLYLSAPLQWNNKNTFFTYLNLVKKPRCFYFQRNIANMSKPTQLIAVEDPELGTIYLEISGQIPTSGDEGWENINTTQEDGTVKKVKSRMSDALESVHLLGKSAIQTWCDLDLDEVELKTGLKFTVSEGKLIGWLAQAEGEFAVEVTLKWKLKPVINNSNPPALS